MGQKFLSDGWFDEAEKIYNEVSPPVPEVLKDLVINVNVNGGPDGDIAARMEAGRLLKGSAEDAPTTLNLPYDVAVAMMVDQDQNAAMQAFMGGQIQVEGDMSKIMMMQAAGPPSPEAEQVAARVKDMTDH